VREAFAELLGINVVKGLGLLLAKDQTKTDVRCAVAHFEARNGVLRSDRMIFDTEPVLGVGEGTIDLRTERMNFKISGKPKEPRLIRLMAPVTVNGPIVQPKIGVEAGSAIAQGRRGRRAGSPGHAHRRHPALRRPRPRKGRLMRRPARGGRSGRRAGGQGQPLSPAFTLPSIDACASGATQFEFQ
jgi:hypothetical protein